jgi:hypothetical protein
MSAVACDLTVFTPEERDQHIALAQQMFATVREVVELPDGYACRLPEESAVLFTLAEFIRDERRCCPFFTFKIVVEADGGAIWLHLTGPEGTKAALLPDLLGVLSANVAARLR